MKWIPHLIILLMMTNMMQNRYKIYNNKITYKSKIDFRNFVIGFLTLIILLVWSWMV